MISSDAHVYSTTPFSHFREGLEWVDIDWNDNGECLDLVERVSLIDVVVKHAIIPFNLL